LRAAGAVILGLTNMDEGALGARGDNPFLGRCHNPYAHGLSPGGSSGGSAVAVAAGLCAAALGTDTIGSVRIPAVYCGVFGHKPRQARIDRHAVVPLSPTFDHVGVIARSAEDCATVLGAMPPGPSDQGRGWGGVDTAADGAHRSGLEHPHPTLPHVGEGLQDEGAGAKRLGVLDVDDPGLAGLAPDAVPIRLPFDFARIARLLLIVAEVEAAAVHGDALRARPEGFSAGFARMLQWGSGAGQSRHAAALQEIATAARAVEAALVGYDALLLPATTQPAFAHDTSAPADQADFMTLAIALGWPATAFPIDTSQGLPIGAQVIARDDATCLALAGTLSRPAVRRPPPAMRR
jgi:aspartyl-tRNA(Asn)/glutamyl-tRNA(Gln) amidotransferase subunit A